MDFLECTKTYHLGSGQQAVIGVTCVNPGQMPGQHRYDKGVVHERTVDPITGHVTYRFVVFDVPDKPVQVALARKLCATGAANVHKNRLDSQGRDNPVHGDKLAIEDDVARESLTAEEYRLLCLLTLSAETAISFWAFVGFALIEGKEGHEGVAALLDRPYDDKSPTAGLGPVNRALTSSE